MFFIGTFSFSNYTPLESITFGPKYKVNSNDTHWINEITLCTILCEWINKRITVCVTYQVPCVLAKFFLLKIYLSPQLSEISKTNIIMEYCGEFEMESRQCRFNVLHHTYMQFEFAFTKMAIWCCLLIWKFNFVFIDFIAFLILGVVTTLQCTRLFKPNWEFWFTSSLQFFWCVGENIQDIGGVNTRAVCYRTYILCEWPVTNKYISSLYNMVTSINHVTSRELRKFNEAADFPIGLRRRKVSIIQRNWRDLWMQVRTFHIGRSGVRRPKGR